MQKAEQSLPLDMKVSRATPQKLTVAQKAIVERAIKMRYAILVRATMNTQIEDPRHDDGLGETLHAGRFGAQPKRPKRPELVKLFNVAMKAIQDYNMVQDKLATEVEEAQREKRRARDALIVRLLNERDANIARLQLEGAADEVAKYLDGLPALDSIRDEMIALGAPPKQLKDALLDAASSIQKLGPKQLT